MLISGIAKRTNVSQNLLKKFEKRGLTKAKPYDKMIIQGKERAQAKK